MPRYKLTIAYDGTEFCGWQKQEPPTLPPPQKEGAGGGVPESPSPREGAGGGSALFPPSPREGAGGGFTSAVEAPHSPQPAYSPRTPLIDSTREGRVALRTVQGVVEQAVRGVCREPIELIGASRTDSGVHARGQVAAFSSFPGEKGNGWPSDRGVDRLMMAINARLPEDVLVTAAEEVAPNFDPIADAISKAYSYTFHISRTRPLWNRRTVTHINHDPSTIDVASMHAAGQLLVGTHDFAAFAAAGHGRLSTVRTIHALRAVLLPLPEGGGGGWVSNCNACVPFQTPRPMTSTYHNPTSTPASDSNPPPTPSLGEGEKIIRLDIAGNGFLWNMVRIIAGTLLDVGTGRMTHADVAAALASRDRTHAGPTARPEGLCLEWIRYA